MSYTPDQIRAMKQQSAIKGGTFTPDQIRQMKRKPEWKDLPGNILPSAGNLVADTVAALASPMETIPALGKVAVGTAQKLIPGRQSQEDSADAVGQYLMQRYGGAEALKRTAITDPAGLVADLSGVLSAGAGFAKTSAKVASRVGAKTPLLSNVAQTAERTSLAIDPLTQATKATGATTKMVGRSAGKLGGVVSGSGSEMSRVAFSRGFENYPLAINNVSKEITRKLGDLSEFYSGKRVGIPKEKLVVRNSFDEAMRGNVTIPKMLETVKDGVDEIVKSGNKEVNVARKGIRSTTKTQKLNTLDVQKDFNKYLVEEFGWGGDNRIPVSERKNIKDALRKIAKTDNMNPSQLEAFISSELKPIVEKAPMYGKTYSQSKAALSKLEKDLTSVLKSKVTGFTESSAKYSEMKQLQKMINQGLNIGDSNSQMTAINKLLSIYNDNNLSEVRRNLVKTVSKKTGKDLDGMLAGMAARGFLPKNLIGKGIGIGIAFGKLNPAALALLPATAGRLVGETSSALGKILGTANAVTSKMPTKQIPAILRGLVTTDKSQ